MTLAQLRYLIAIADSGLNITLAAERVYATQPGLSKQLRQLEDELGFQLFLRKGKSLDAITHAGEQVIERARIILAEAANIRSIAANLRNEACGELRIATTHTQARFALPTAIAALATSYPEVSVHLEPTRDADVLARLEAGQVDMAIISSAGVAPSSGVAFPAYHWQRVIVTLSDHALARRRTAPTLAELAQLPLISYDSSLRPESSLRRAFAAADLTPQIAMTAGDADLIKTYVRAGLGVGILAEMAMLDGDADLQTLPADQLFAPCTTWVVVRRDCVLREYMLAFIHLFAPHLGRREVTRVMAGDPPDPAWQQVPHWRERNQSRAAEAA